MYSLLKCLKRLFFQEHVRVLHAFSIKIRSQGIIQQAAASQTRAAATHTGKRDLMDLKDMPTFDSSGFP